MPSSLSSYSLLSAGSSAALTPAMYTMLPPVGEAVAAGQALGEALMSRLSHRLSEDEFLALTQEVQRIT